MSDFSYQIAKDYASGQLKGWAGTDHPELVKEQFEVISREGYIKRKLHISGQTRSYAGGKYMLYQYARKLFGHDLPCIAQQIGDCVSFGAEHAASFAQISQILGGQAAKFRPIFQPYYYGTGRVYVGKGQMGNEDGSSGAWMAKAVQLYGTLFADEPGVPKYSGAVAKAWGDPNPGPDLDRFRTTGSKYLIGAVAPIHSWEDLVSALANGYAVTTASDVGYDMQASPDGFFRQTTSWSHQMCFIASDETYKEPYALLLNNWGDVHGHLKDFADGHDLPQGVLRIRRSDAEKHIAAGETFAYSHMALFIEQDLDKSLFDLIGKD